MTFPGSGAIEKALEAVGQQLAVSDALATVVVVGGATLNVLGTLSRSTNDVDVIAQAYRDDRGTVHFVRAEPFPQSLRVAIAAVARDFGLQDDWMNAVVGAQWAQGFPPTMHEDITWRTYANLEVGFVGRRTLIALKLFAAADCGPTSVHAHDLLALAPTDEELQSAIEWVETQDTSPTFPSVVQEVAAYVRRSRIRHR